MPSPQHLLESERDNDETKAPLDETLTAASTDWRGVYAFARLAQGLAAGGY